MKYDTLSRDSYLEFHQTLKDKDFNFSKVAIGMWDFMKAWEKWPVRILKEGEDIVSVCFMKVSGQAGTKVLFISNIFTPTEHKKKGYAREMLDWNILEGVKLEAGTLRMDCNRKALPFYDALGTSYWGTTIEQSMFCDLPIDNSGVEGFWNYRNVGARDILDLYPEKLRTAKMKWIAKKVRRHEEFDYGHPSRYNQFMHLWRAEGAC
jgi:hypothetical protein